MLHFFFDIFCVRLFSIIICKLIKNYKEQLQELIGKQLISDYYYRSYTHSTLIHTIRVDVQDKPLKIIKCVCSIIQYILLKINFVKIVSEWLPKYFDIDTNS